MFLTIFYPKHKIDFSDHPEKDRPMLNTILHVMDYGKERESLMAALNPIFSCGTSLVDGTHQFTMEF